MSPSGQNRTPWLSRTVVALGAVSLLTDAATEMVMPLLPVFLTVVLGAGPLALGIIEGAAEATASLLKVASGYWTDRTGRRKPFVLSGYTLSSLVRPLIALTSTPAQVLAIRLGDRVGKGLRSSPRDALIAAAVPARRHASAFGFHRAMDHLGAVIGPLIAFLVLSYWTSDLRTLFWCSAIPGALAVAVLVLFVREPAPSEPPPDRVPRGDTARSVTLSPLLLPLGLFTLGNASDLFLLLRLSETQAPLTTLPLLWIGLHLVKTATSLAGGGLADALGRRRMLAVGWLLYAVIYAGFAIAESRVAMVVLFLVYGAHHGLSEAPEKALVAELAPPRRQGLAYGWYHAVLGLGGLVASVLFGFLWQQHGSSVAFFTGAALALAATILLLVLLPGDDERRRSAALTGSGRAAPPP